MANDTIKSLSDQITKLNLTKVNWINIKSCGAVGDGVTDDTAAFNAAKKAGNYIYIPSGTYLLKNVSISNKENVGIIGDGAILLCKANSTPYYGVLGFYNIKGLYISGITIDGNKKNVAGSETGGVFNFYIKNCSNFIIDHCKSINSNYGSNVFYDGCNNGIISDCNFDAIDCGLIFANTDEAVRNGSSLPAHDIRIQNCVFSGGTSEGISLSTRLSYEDKSFYQHYNFDIHDCVFDSKSNSGSSILLMNSDKVNIYNCTFRNSGNLHNNGITLFKANSSNIFNNTFDNIYYRALNIGNLATNSIVTGCVFKNGIESPSVKIYGNDTIFKYNTMIDAATNSMLEVKANDVLVVNNTFVLDQLTNFKYMIRVLGDCNNVRINENTFINDKNVNMNELYINYGTKGSFLEIADNKGIKQPRLENDGALDVCVIHGAIGSSYQISTSGQYDIYKTNGYAYVEIMNSFNGTAAISGLRYKGFDGDMLEIKSMSSNLKLVNTSSTYVPKDNVARLLAKGEVIKFISKNKVWYEIS